MTDQVHSRLEVVRILVLIQGGIAVVSMLEVLVVSALGGPLLAILLLSGAAAVLTLALAARIVRGSRRARKTLVVLQLMWLFGAIIDLLLSLFLAKHGFELVPLLTRVVLPMTILRMLRRPWARERFGIKPSRRQRRRAQKTDEATPAGAPV